VLRDLSGGWLWPVLAGIALACWGASIVLGGVFPMPDERHGGFGLGLARATCAAVCVAGNSKGSRHERNETVSWLYLCWLGDRARDHVRRRAPDHAPRRWTLAADQYRHLHSMVRGAWSLAAQTRCEYSARGSPRGHGSLTSLRQASGLAQTPHNAVAPLANRIVIERDFIVRDREMVIERYLSPLMREKSSSLGCDSSGQLPLHIERRQFN
jgi:hypothetical protein